VIQHPRARSGGCLHLTTQGKLSRTRPPDAVRQSSRRLPLYRVGVCKAGKPPTVNSRISPSTPPCWLRISEVLPRTSRSYTETP